MGLIDDPETISTAYNRLAESQAKAVRYAEAEANLQKVVAATESSKWAKEQTRKLIARYKAEGRKDPPKNGPSTISKGFAASAPSLAIGAKLDNLAEIEKAEKAAETAKGAANKAARGEIAWALL